MKARWLLIGSLVMAAVFAWCAGEDGKDGADGRDGADGAQGIQGPPGTEQCMQCHDDEFDLQFALMEIGTQFEVSKHNEGDTYLRRGAGCARCHTNEGFQHHLAHGDSPARASASRIGCFTCHAPHSNQNFDVRMTDPTPIDIGGTYDLGQSNTCAVCHQARRPVPGIAEADSAITSSRWGPHHSTQGNLLTGQGAYVFAGATYAVTSHATIPDGCVTCHMGPSYASSYAEAGGHTFSVTYPTTSDPAGPVAINRRGCQSVTGCHVGWDTDTDATDYTHGFQEEVHQLLDQIRGELVARGWLNANTGLLIPANIGDLTADDRGAIWNFLFIEEDFSAGVHNPAYTIDVLEATLAYLD